MRPKYLIARLALPLAFAATAGAVAAPPDNASAVTLDADPTIIVYSGSTTLSGRVSGNDASGAAVRLEQDNTLPYGDSYQPTGVGTTTANNGKYALTVKPLLNTQYRVVAKTSPSVTSAPKIVRVRMLVGIKVSDSTPERGSLVRFSGSVFPGHDGRKALIQKRTSSGRFVTVARKTLADAGTLRSSYSRRIRIYRDGVYRVKVAGDADHANGFSRLRSVNVHG